MPTNVPTVSIITATFNSVDTVGECLSSIRAQTHTNIESIVVDGASTDGTQALIQRNFADVVRHMISEPDDGIYDALNKGINASTGDIIGLLHSDDVLAAPDVIEGIANAFSDPRIDAVYGDLVYVSRNDPEQVIRYWKSSHFHRSLLHRGWMPPHPTLYLRRSLLDRIGLFDTNYAIAADYDHVLRIFQVTGISTRYLPRVLVKMKVGGASNKSFANVLQKSREDLRALHQNHVGGLPTLLMKNISKVGQFFTRATRQPAPTGRHM